MPEAHFIEFMKDRRLLGGVALREDARSFHVLGEDGRHHKITADKVVLKTRIFVDNAADENVLLPAVKRTVALRCQVEKDIVLADLWELLQEESYPRSPRELAEIWFGAGCSQDELSAMTRALLDNRVYFERRHDDYAPRPRDEVQRTVHRLKVEDEKLRARETFAQYSRQLYAGLSPEPPEDVLKLQELLQSYIVLEKDSPSSRELEEILKLAGLSATDAPFTLLVKMGIFSPDENLLLHKLAVAREFPLPVMEEAERVAGELLGDFGARLAGREDLRGLDCFTVDSDATTELDDALSIRSEGGRHTVGVHIADPSEIIDPGSLLGAEIRRRGTAIYMADLKIPMMPAVLGAHAASLVEGQDRLALSIMVEMDDEGGILGSRIVESVINVRRRLSYESALALIAGGGDLAVLYRLALVLQRRRVDKGACLLPFLRLDVSLGPDGQVIVEKEDPDRPSQVLVSEMMILANTLTGSFFQRNCIPAVYRGQPCIDSGAAIPAEYDPVALFHLRRHIRRAAFGITPARHHGLGVDHYVQVTSPIRRYSDFVMHRQMKSFLKRGAPCHSEGELKEIVFENESTLEQADLLERDRKSYWLLRYLERHVGEKLPATVLASFFDKAVVVLDDCLWETELPLTAGTTLPPGQKVTVRLERVWPREGVLRVSLG